MYCDPDYWPYPSLCAFFDSLVNVEFGRLAAAGQKGRALPTVGQFGCGGGCSGTSSQARAAAIGYWLGKWLAAPRDLGKETLVRRRVGASRIADRGRGGKAERLKRFATNTFLV